MAVSRAGIGAPPLTRHPELRAGGQFDGRLRRLAAVSVPGLGSAALLAATTLDVPAVVVASLVAGWVLMPALLLLGRSRPTLRYALVAPALLVGLPLLAICARWLPGDAVAAGGWIALTLGILLGGLQGLWFWFRLLPVPAALDDPFSPGRWSLVALHVALVVGGLVAVTGAALA